MTPSDTLSPPEVSQSQDPDRPPEGAIRIGWKGETLMSDGLKIGFRIEFLDDGKPSLAVICEDAFVASTVPRVGELVSSQIIAGITPPPWLPVPFVTVAAVEHYPVKPPDTPGVQVVIQLEVQVSQTDLRPLEEQGWTVW